MIEDPPSYTPDDLSLYLDDFLVARNDIEEAVEHCQWAMRGHLALLMGEALGPHMEGYHDGSIWALDQLARTAVLAAERLRFHGTFVRVVDAADAAELEDDEE